MAQARYDSAVRGVKIKEAAAWPGKTTVAVSKPAYDAYTKAERARAKAGAGLKSAAKKKKK